MKKYKNYYYSVVKSPDGYVWRIYNKYRPEGRECLELSAEDYDTKTKAGMAAEEAIDEYYR